MGMDGRPLPKGNPPPDVGKGIDLTASSDLSTLLYYSEGADVEIFTELHPFGTACIGGDTTECGCRLLLYELHQLSERCVGICHTDEGRGDGLLGSEVVGDEEDRSLGRIGVGLILRVS